MTTPEILDLRRRVAAKMLKGKPFFLPTCPNPRCGWRNYPDAKNCCECGTRLYPRPDEIEKARA